MGKKGELLLWQGVDNAMFSGAWSWYLSQRITLIPLISVWTGAKSTCVPSTESINNPLSSTFKHDPNYFSCL